MLQYPNLSLDDISYYWQRSLLMVEIDGKFKSCLIANTDYSSKHPILLVEVNTGEKIIALSLRAFIRRVLMHHPAVGYGDFRGVPLYLSPRAGQERRKGVNVSNMTVLCPLDWAASLKNTIDDITKTQRSKTSKNNTLQMSPTLQRKYSMYRKMLADLRMAPDSNYYKDVGILRIRGNYIISKIMEQCVNNNYVTIKKALNILQNDKIFGVSISRDFALLNTVDCKYNLASIYFLQSPIGYISKAGGKVFLNGKLSSGAKLCIQASFDKIGIEDYE